MQFATVSGHRAEGCFVVNRNDMINLQKFCTVTINSKKFIDNSTNIFKNVSNMRKPGPRYVANGKVTYRNLYKAVWRGGKGLASVRQPGGQSPQGELA